MGDWNCKYISQVTLVVNDPPANAENIGDIGSIPGWVRIPAVGNSNLLQYYRLENAWTGSLAGYSP